MDEGPGHHLQRLGHGPVGPLFHPGEASGALAQPLGHRHLHGAPSWQQPGLQQHVTTHLHGVLQVPLHLLQQRSTQKELRQAAAAAYPLVTEKWRGAGLTARISLLAPRSSTVQALGSRHSVTKVKYSSPICLTWNNPAPVPTSSSRSSSVRLAMRPPHALREADRET